VAGDSILSVFASAVAPPLTIALVGYLLGRWREVDVDTLSTVTIYVLLPALVFHSLVTISIDGATVGALVATMVGFTAVMGVIGSVVAHVAGESGVQLRGAALSAAFPNTGNFGIPVATFAFGAVGRTTAVVFVLVQNVLLFTVGVYALARGGEASSRTAALKRVFGLPATYAVGVAALALWLDAVPPADGAVMQTIELTGNASIPIFLLLLGLQLAEMSPSTAVRRTLPTVGVKLLAAPVIAVAVALAVGIGNPTAARSFVLLAAGPAAVTPLVLAIEFTGASDGVSAAEYVGTVVVLTILGSLPTVTGLIFLLRRGLIL